MLYKAEFEQLLFFFYLRKIKQGQSGAPGDVPFAVSESLTMTTGMIDLRRFGSQNFRVHKKHQLGKKDRNPISSVAVG